MRYADFVENISRAENDLTHAVGGSVTGCRYFDYNLGQPNLYLLMRFKQALVAEFGLEGGFAAYRQTVTTHAATRLKARHLASQLAFAATNATAFTELAPAGEAFTVAPPRVIGAGNHRPLARTTRSFYLACLTDALVRGRSETITIGDHCLVDFQGSELSSIVDELEFDPAIFHAAGSAVDDIAAEADAELIRLAEAFTLVGAHTDFFGHWMWEYLPRYVAATLSGALPPVPVMIDAHMPPPHRQALELLLGGAVPIIEIPAFAQVLVHRLWCAPSLIYMPLHERRGARFTWDHMAPSPARFAPVIDEMTRRVDRAPGSAGGPQLVFLARKDFRHRKLVNRAAIEAMAQQRGFTLAYPEDLDFIEQVRLLRRARFVIAPEGSAIFLAFFAQAGLRLCILNHPDTEALAIYSGLLRGKAADITVLTGPEVKKHYELAHYSDYRIDETGFNRFLDKWLASGRSDMARQASNPRLI